MFSATFGPGVSGPMKGPSMAQGCLCTSLWRQHLAADFLDAYTFVAVGRVGGAARTVRRDFCARTRDDACLSGSGRSSSVWFGWRTNRKPRPEAIGQA